MTTAIHRASRALLFTAFTLALAHCGSPTPGDTTTMDAADITVAPDVADVPVMTDTRPGDGSVGTLAWGRCAGVDLFYECATLSVPMNYDNPTGPRIQLRVMRFVARVPAGQRRGTLMVNRGGPGLESRLWLLDNSGLRGYFGSAAAAYDILVWDVRGSSESIPAIDCTTTAYDALRNADLTPDDPAEEMTLRQAFADIRAACLRDVPRELLENVGVESTVRDMEQIRIGLGEARIHYYGVGSGSYLGAAYASMYPQHVGAFMLDSNVDPTADRVRLGRERATATLDAVMQFFTWCAAQTEVRCPYRRGATTGAEIAARFLALWQRVEMTPVPVAARVLTGSDLAIGAFESAGSVDWVELGPALAMLDQTTPDGTRLLGMADSTWGGRTPGSVSVAFARYAAIMAHDFPFAEGFTEMQYLDGFRMLVRPELPPFPTMQTFDRLGLDWPIRPRRPRPTISAAMAPPILLLAARYDPTTPVAWTAAMARALGNTTYTLTYQGVGHGALAAGPTCVRDQVSAYLMDQTRPPPMTSCAAELP